MRLTKWWTANRLIHACVLAHAPFHDNIGKTKVELVTYSRVLVNVPALKQQTMQRASNYAFRYSNAPIYECETHIG